MGEGSGIAWTNHTFNPWWGCTKVSPACANCYAERLAVRLAVAWGPGAARRFFPDGHWNEPLKWARKARRTGVRPRVFTGSMCDVFEDRPDLHDPRLRLYDLILTTADALDWLLLTKRPDVAVRLLPDDVAALSWVGTTIEDQAAADLRLDLLLQIPARVWFVSCEPLLGSLNLIRWLVPGPCGSRLSWIITGGESGPHARPFDLDHARRLRDQAVRAGVPFFLKQFSGLRPDHLPALDGQVWQQVPARP